MPYRSNDELPEGLRRHLPPGAQGIFRKTFNRAWQTYRTRPEQQREEVAHRVAWAAVKRKYRKFGTDWVQLEI